MNSDTLLTEAEAAGYLNLPPAQLRQWRYYGRGPRFLKLGRAVRYRREDLDAYLNANAVEPQGAA